MKSSVQRLLETKCYTIKICIGGKLKIHIDTKKICCAHDEAAHILYTPLPVSVWMKQLPLYKIGCKTQIALIFINIFKAASCYIIVAMKTLELLY